MEQKPNVSEAVYRKKLEAYSIYDLRNYAREMGVHSPTSRKKGDLIDRIADIYFGRTEPITRSSRGAPLKSKVVPDELKQDFLPAPQEQPKNEISEIPEIKRGRREERKIVFASPTGEKPTETHYNECDPDFTVEGIVFVSENGSGTLYFPTEFGPKETCRLGGAMVYRYNLRTGDRLRGRADTDAKGNRIVAEVLAVNGKTSNLQALDISEFERILPVPSTQALFSPSSVNRLARTLQIFCPVSYGNTVLVHAPRGTGITTFIRDFCKETDATPVCLLIEAHPADGVWLRSALPGAEVFVYEQGAERTDLTLKTELVQERAKRIAEEGNKVILFIDSLTKLVRSFSEWEADATHLLPCGVSFAAVRAAKRIMGLSRALENGGSITTVGVLNTETGTEADRFIAENLSGTENAAITLSKKLAASGVFPAVDIDRTGVYTTVVEDDDRKLNQKLRDLLPPTGKTEAFYKLLDRFATNGELAENSDAALRNL